MTSCHNSASTLQCGATYISDGIFYVEFMFTLQMVQIDIGAVFAATGKLGVNQWKFVIILFILNAYTAFHMIQVSKRN